MDASMWQRPVGRLPIHAEPSALTWVDHGTETTTVAVLRHLRVRYQHTCGSYPFQAVRAGGGSRLGGLRYNARVSRLAVRPGSLLTEALSVVSFPAVLDDAVILTGMGLGRVPPSR
jgi:hypothetical protein